MRDGGGLRNVLDHALECSPTQRGYGCGGDFIALKASESSDRSIPWLHPFPGHISLQVNGLHFLQFSRQWQSGVVATETGRPAEPKMTIWPLTEKSCQSTV